MFFEDVTVQKSETLPSLAQAYGHKASDAAGIWKLPQNATFGRSGNDPLASHHIRRRGYRQTSHGFRFPDMGIQRRRRRNDSGRRTAGCHRC